MTTDAQTAAHSGDINQQVSFLEGQNGSHASSRDVIDFVTDLKKSSQSDSDYRSQIDAIYNRIYSDSASDPSLQGLLPQIDICDSRVDAQGAANDRGDFSGNDGRDYGDSVKLDQHGHATTASDGNSGISTDPETGNVIAFNKTDRGVNVTTGANGEVTEHNYPNVAPDSVKMTDDGSVTMNRNDGKGTITVHTDGTEDNHIVTSTDSAGKPKDTVDVTRDGTGKITDYHNSKNPNMTCKDGKWENLPGTRDDQGNQYHAENVQVYADGTITYEFPKGIQGHDGDIKVRVSPSGIAQYTDAEGNIVRYEAPNGETLDRRDNEWYWSTKGGDPIAQPHGTQFDPHFDGDRVTYGRDSESDQLSHVLGSPEEVENPLNKKK